MKEHKECRMKEMSEKLSDDLKEKINPRIGHKLYNKDKFRGNRLWKAKWI